MLPGARLPPECLLPEGFSFAYIGGRSAGWGKVGVFVLAELELDIVVLDMLIHSILIIIRLNKLQMFG